MSSFCFFAEPYDIGPVFIGIGDNDNDGITRVAIGTNAGAATDSIAVINRDQAVELLQQLLTIIVELDSGAS